MLDLHTVYFLTPSLTTYFFCNQDIKFLILFLFLDPITLLFFEIFITRLIFLLIYAMQDPTKKHFLWRKLPVERFVLL